MTILTALKKTFSLFPDDTPEFIYTTIFKPKLLKKTVNRILLKIIPEKLLLKSGSVLYLNSKDPVVSSALALGIYENYETEIFKNTLKKGMTLVDIGANIGYYTVLAADIIGETGKIISFEPDEQSMDIFKKNIISNKFKNVSYVEKALSDKKGTILFYPSDENRGDNRIYDPGDGRKYVEVETITLDEYLPQDTKVDIIKMDIQGGEYLALVGMEKTILRSESLTIFAEFWPKGIMETGKSPEEFLKKLKGYGFSLYNIKSRERKIEKIEDIEQFTKKYQGREYTNIIGYKNSKSAD